MQIVKKNNLCYNIQIMLYILDEINRLGDLPIDRLSEQRREKVFKQSRRLSQKLSIVVYLLLRMALKEEYNIDEPVEFDFEANGKPRLKDHKSIHFNLSHSKNIAACVVSSVPVGIDVQNIVPVSDKTAMRVLTESEYTGFKSSKNPDEYFCRIWVIKESYFKQSGQGISPELNNLSADSLSDITICRGNDFFCCTTGSDTIIRNVRREEIER